MKPFRYFVNHLQMDASCLQKVYTLLSTPLDISLETETTWQNLTWTKFGHYLEKIVGPQRIKGRCIKSIKTVSGIDSFRLLGTYIHPSKFVIHISKSAVETQLFIEQ